MRKLILALFIVGLVSICFADIDDRKPEAKYVQPVRISSFSVAIAVGEIKSSSQTTSVTIYPQPEIIYSTSVIKDQNYGSGSQLTAGSTFYWAILDGTQTKDYYLKEIMTMSEASNVFIVLYTGGNGATDLQLLNSGSAAFTNAIYIEQSSTYHNNLNFNLHNRKISAGTILRMLFNNTSTSAGDLIANMHYSVKQ